jgi:hypothetical protein
MTQENLDKAINTIDISGYPEIEIDLDRLTVLPEVVGFGYGSEEEERQDLIEEYGQEWVDENFIPWAELERQREEKEEGEQ